VRSIIFVFLLIFSTKILATDLAAIEVDDPILNGKKCVVHEPAGWGSYIYHSPSKYDQIFWPLTEEYGIWYCADSGFMALTNDFEQLGKEEIERISIYLKTNSSETKDIKSKLKTLDQIYSLRDKDTFFKNKLMRVLARFYQSESEFEIANEYRKKSLDDIEITLNGEVPEFQKLEYLYLAVNYSKQFGNDAKASAYKRKLMIALSSIENDDVKGLGKYLEGLIPDSEYIEPGGKLDPIKPK